MVFPPKDFKSFASAIPPLGLIFGGTTQIRTGGEGFAGPCLTTWLWCHVFLKSGGSYRTRTYDPLLVRQMLSQLS